MLVPKEALSDREVIALAKGLRCPLKELPSLLRTGGEASSGPFAVTVDPPHLKACGERDS